MTDGTIIMNGIDSLAVCSNIMESASKEVAYISPPSLLVIASQFGLTDKTKLFIQKGGRVRAIVNLSYPYIKQARERLASGVDLRHISQYQGIFLLVGDEVESISTMTVSGENLTIDTPVVALWSDDHTYAEFLMVTFETAWKRSIPAKERIEELLKEGPPDM